MKKAFTLIEVNLAMMIMAGGILSIVGLYAFGFRENRQSREDVTAAAFADAVVSPLAMMIGSTNVTWSRFRTECYYPDKEGWGEYFEDDGVVKRDPESTAEGAFGTVQSWVGVTGQDALGFPSDARPNNTSCGIVIMHPKDSAVATIGFRAVPTDKPGMLLAMPLFFTEVRFQGVVD